MKRLTSRVLHSGQVGRLVLGVLALLVALALVAELVRSL